MTEKIPDNLKPWVATGDQGPTKVAEPLYIDYRAAKDLFPYHPGFLGSKEYKLKHVAKEISEGDFVVVVEDLSDNWDEDFRTVTENLTFRLKTDSFGTDYLIDNEIDGPAMAGWAITQWVVSRNLNSSGDRVHQDLITWVKDEIEILSMYTWPPYSEEDDDDADTPDVQRIALFVGHEP